MIPQNINIGKYAKEYWKNNSYPEGPKLFWEARVEAILYTLADEKEKYDEPYTYNLINIMISAYIKFAPKVLAENILNMEYLFCEIEEEDEIWDVALEAMKQDIPDEEKIDKIFSSLEKTYNEMVENKRQREYEAEMYRLQHPIISRTKKLILPLIITGVILWIVMTILAANGTIQVPNFVGFIPYVIVFGIFFIFICIILRLAIFNGGKK